MPVAHLWRRRIRKTGSVTPPPEVVVLIGDRRDEGAKMTILGASIVIRGLVRVVEVRMRSQNTVRCAVLDRIGHTKH